MNIFWKTFLLFCLLSSGFPALQAAPDSVKITAYIFRWGENQKVLDRKNKFKATIYLTPDQFRRTLWSIPHMEKATELKTSQNGWRYVYKKIPVIACKIDGTPFEFQRDEPTENKMAFRLEHQLLPCRPGQTHRITDIPLDNGRKGQIDLVIRAPKTGIEQATIRKPMGPLTIADPIITSFRWGPHIDLQLDRDFFTVQEFWETVATQPEATMPGKTEVSNILMAFKFFMPNQMHFANQRSVFAYPNQQQNLLEALQKNLDTLREQIKPGVLVETEINLYSKSKQFSHSQFSTQSYYPKVQVRFLIVADDDPRLALRRSRDAHRVRIRVGDQEETYPSLYLRQYAMPNGDTLHADPPIDINWLQPTSEFTKSIQSWPRMWIDDREIEVKSLSFNATVADSTVALINAYMEKRRRMAANPDSIRQFFQKEYAQRPPHYTRTAWSAKTMFNLQTLVQPSILYYSLYRFEADGYDLTPIQLQITRPDTTLKSLMDHYTYEDFEAMPIDPRIQLIEIPDTISKKAWDATPVDSRPKAYFTITEADYVNIGHSHLNAKGESRGGGGSADHARSQAGVRHSISLENTRIDADSAPGTYLFYVQSARGVARKRIVVTE